LVVGKWTTSPEFSNIREIAFKSPVRSSLGPNTTRLSETQRYHMQENKLLIDNIQILHDIPYGDYFRIEGRWIVTPVNSTIVKLVVSLGVSFSKKTVWKGKIETGVIKETQESYQNWVMLAKQTISISQPPNIEKAATVVAPLIIKPEVVEVVPAGLPKKQITIPSVSIPRISGTNTLLSLLAVYTIYILFLQVKLMLFEAKLQKYYNL